jgi:hypothetical protein
VAVLLWLVDLLSRGLRARCVIVTFAAVILLHLSYVSIDLMLSLLTLLLLYWQR